MCVGAGVGLSVCVCVTISLLSIGLAREAHELAIDEVVQETLQMAGDIYECVKDVMYV